MLFISFISIAEERMPYDNPYTSNPYVDDSYRSPNSTLGSGNVELNRYGSGVGMDQYGRAISHEPNLQLKQDAYGPGVHMDQYGRAVKQYGDTLR